MGRVISKILLWIATVLLALLGIGILPHWSSILALLVIVLIVPIDKWQKALRKILPKAVKVILSIGLVVALLAVMPAAETPTQQVVTDTPTTTTTNSTQTTTTALTTTESTHTTTQSCESSATTITSTTTRQKTTIASKVEQTTKTTTVTTQPPTTKKIVTTVKTVSATTYVLNTNTHKFHYQRCRSVNQMEAENKDLYTGTRESLIQSGYSPCGICKP